MTYDDGAIAVSDPPRLYAYFGCLHRGFYSGECEITLEQSHHYLMPEYFKMMAKYFYAYKDDKSKTIKNRNNWCILRGKFFVLYVF